MRVDVRYLRDTEVAEITGLALSTLRNARSKGEGIPYIKTGRCVRYRLQDVVQFMDSHRVDTEGSGRPGERAD